jgi:hypothetical protein
VTSGYPTLCPSCTHYQGDFFCTSFPRGTPIPIVRYGADHRRPIRDEGTFELNETKHEAFDEWLGYNPHGPSWGS